MQRLLIMALMVFVLFALVACGGNSDMSNTMQEPSTTQDNNATTDNEPLDTATDEILAYEEESAEASEPSDAANAPLDDASSFTITVAERNAQANATSYFNVQVISKTFVDTGFGMYDDFGGYILVFELENISGRTITVDISAVFRWEYGEAATLIDPQDVHFEPGQTRQFTHSFGEYNLSDPTPLIIEYWNVRF